jgi:hypothetical protein
LGSLCHQPISMAMQSDSSFRKHENFIVQQT